MKMYFCYTPCILSEILLVSYLFFNAINKDKHSYYFFKLSKEKPKNLFKFRFLLNLFKSFVSFYF